jgi:hypothetical protein
VIDIADAAEREWLPAKVATRARRDRGHQDRAGRVNAWVGRTAAAGYEQGRGLWAGTAGIVAPRALRGIAAELDRRGIRTARGGQWHATTVRNLLARSAG